MTMALVLATLPLGLNSSTWTDLPMNSSDLARRADAMNAIDIVKLIQDKSLNIAESYEIYKGSILETLATTSWAGTPLYDTFVNYYGSTTFLDDYLKSAFEGTGQFAGEYAGSIGQMSSAQAEAVEKALVNQVLVMAALSTVAQAPTTTLVWELAYAYWVGNSEGEAYSGDQDPPPPIASPWARANARCKDYDTCCKSDDTCKHYETGTALANVKVMIAIQNGWDATQNQTNMTIVATKTAAALAELEDGAMIVHYQSVLKYAYDMDDERSKTPMGDTAKPQGEGGAFWRTIEPLLAARDPIISAWVTEMYEMTAVPTGKEQHRYCVLKYLLDNNLPRAFVNPKCPDDEGSLQDACILRQFQVTTAGDFGSLIAAESVTCYNGLQVAPLSSGDTAPSDELAEAYKASANNEKLAGEFGEFNIDSIKEYYVDSDVQKLAKKAWGTPTYATFVSYYGSDTFLDEQMLLVIEGKGQFAGEVAPSKRGNMESARNEAFKKGYQDNILVMAALSSLEKGSDKIASWQMMWAYWTGEVPKYAPWARANKRCTNYATCGNFTSGVQDNVGKAEKARANSNLLLATVRATQALAADSSADVTTYEDTVVGNVLIIYYQASLRYTYFLDNSGREKYATAEYQGEGGAFWRVIAPLLAETEPVDAAVVSAFYDMSNNPEGTFHYCRTRKLLFANLPKAMTLSDFGALTIVTPERDVCTFPPPPPSAPPVPSLPEEELSSSDSGLATGAIVGFAVLGGALLVSLVGNVICMMQVLVTKNHTTEVLSRDLANSGDKGGSHL